METSLNTGCPRCSLRLALSPEALTPLEAKRPLPPGLRSRFFGDYEIIDEIARGGMGVVYRARQLSLNRLVALKMIQSHHLLSDEARLRFRVEIESVAQLHHPHIVSLYESGEHDGAHYFTMSLVDGGDLSGDLARERPLRQRIRLLVKVCRAVHYAHQRGILHRDLKPSNILVDQQGEPHVADFGLAKSLDNDSGFTFTSSLLGSPNYMAPEQASGKVRQLTTAVDVYGLGAILYHILAGRPPFQAGTPIETLRQVVDHDPSPPRVFRRGVDPDLETIALKCLRKEPSGRYGTAEELAQDLELWLVGEPIVARPLGPVATAWRWFQRHPAVAVLAAGLTLALAVIVAGTAFGIVRVRDAEGKAAGHLRESLLREAGSLRLMSEVGNRDHGLRLIREASALGGSDDFRQRLRDELLATLARAEPRFFPAQATNLNPLPDLNGIHTRFGMSASVEDQTNIVFRTLEGAAYNGRLVSRDGPVTRVDVFSPNGYFLALRHRGAVSVWDLRTGLPSLQRAGTNLVFAFHPTEEVVVFQESPNEAVWFDLPSGAERLRWTAPVQRPSGRPSGWHTLMFSPDGRWLAGTSPGTVLIELLNPRDGRQVRLLTNSAGVIAMGWSADGDKLAAATGDSRVQIWNPASGALEWTSPAMVAPANSLAFRPHRDWLVAGCRDGKVRFFDTHQKRFIYEHVGDSRRLAFSPHGIRLGPVWSEGRLGWLQMNRTEEFVAFGAGSSTQRLTDGAFSPDGRVLAVGHTRGLIFCNPRVGRAVKVRNDWSATACVFEPDGSHLMVGSSKGLWRYAYDLDGARLSLSPVELIHPSAHWRALALTTDGGRMAAFNRESKAVFVFDHTRTNQIASFQPHPGTEALAFSSDGQWLASSSSGERSVKVWNATEGRDVLSVNVGERPRGSFSADGRWFAASGDRFDLRETGSWKPGPLLHFADKQPILGAAAFSPDSAVLALVVNRFEVHLFDLRTFGALGVLRSPSPVQIQALEFSPDGSQLGAWGAEGRVAVWQWQALQERLEGYGMGWNGPARQASRP